MGGSEAFLKRVEEILSPQALDIEPSSLRGYSVSGAPPAAIVAPTEAHQITGIMEAAELHGGSLVTVGSGTKLNAGGPPRGEYLALSTGGLNRISDHDVPNFTVTAQAGIDITSLQHALAEEGQLLPLDPPYRDATLGGTICSNNNGPLRLLYGGLRDLILGARVVLPGGRRGGFGGKVVKNVAGYDISKFLIGSMGTLCVLEEVTLKLFPLPEREAACAALFGDPGAAFAAADELRASQLLPARIVLLDYDALTLAGASDIALSQRSRYTMLTSYHGFEETVRRRLRETGKVYSAHGATHVETLRSDRDLWEKMRAVNQRAAERSATILRLGLPCADLAEAFGRLRWSAKALNGTGTLVDAGCGIIYIYLFPDESLSREVSFQRGLENLAAAANGYGGYMSVENAPPHVGKTFVSDANRRIAYEVMELIRQRFDPRGVLCPERLPWLFKA